MKSYCQELRSWVSQVLAGAPVEIPQLSAEDQDQCIKFCEEQGVVPMVVYRLQQSNQFDELPRELTVRLTRINRRHFAAQMVSQSKLKLIISMLNEHDIDFILLKGEALGQTKYPQPHMRVKSDIDLLFATQDESERAWQLFRSRGYCRHRSLEGEFVGYQYVCDKKYSNGFCMVFDNHYQITNYQWFNQRLKYADLKSNATEIVIGNEKVWVLNNVFALIHACIHRITNKSKMTEDRLIWLFDIHLLYEGMSDSEFQELTSISAEKNISHIVLEGIKSAQNQFSGMLVDNKLIQFEEDAKKGGSAIMQGNRRLQLYWHDFINHEGVANKISMLRERVFPKSDYMVHRYKLPHKRYIAFYYIKRVIDLLTKR